MSTTRPYKAKPNTDPDQEVVIGEGFVYAHGDVRLVDNPEIMSYPYYSVSKRSNNASRIFTTRTPQGEAFSIELNSPDATGMQTIHDHKIIILLISYLNASYQSGQTLSMRVRTSAHNLMAILGKCTGGGNYEELDAAINRLMITTVVRWIGDEKPKHRPINDRNYAKFNFITSIKLVEGMYEIELNRELVRPIGTNRMLSVTPDFLKMTSGFEQRMYQIFRKHAGNQREGYWLPMAALHKKCGSEELLRKFKYRVSEFIRQKNNLPEYYLELGEDTDRGDGVWGVRRDLLHPDHPCRSLEAIGKRKKLIDSPPKKDRLSRQLSLLEPVDNSVD